MRNAVLDSRVDDVGMGGVAVGERMGRGQHHLFDPGQRRRQRRAVEIVALAQLDAQRAKILGLSGVAHERDQVVGRAMLQEGQECVASERSAGAGDKYLTQAAFLRFP